MKGKLLDTGGIISTIVLFVSMVSAMLCVSLAILFYTVGFAKNGFDFMMSMF